MSNIANLPSLIIWSVVTVVLIDKYEYYKHTCVFMYIYLYLFELLTAMSLCCLTLTECKI